MQFTRNEWDDYDLESEQEIVELDDLQFNVEME